MRLALLGLWTSAAIYAWWLIYLEDADSVPSWIQPVIVMLAVSGVAALPLVWFCFLMDSLGTSLDPRSPAPRSRSSSTASGGDNPLAAHPGR